MGSRLFKMELFDGSGKSKKRCGKCRYFIQRRVGSFNTGFGVSKWGLCDSNRGLDLTGRGLKYLGMVHDSMTCQLPNVGKAADWREIVRAPAGMKKAKPYSAHPSVVDRFASSEEKYERQWHLERNRELEEKKMRLTKEDILDCEGESGIKLQRLREALNEYIKRKQELYHKISNPDCDLSRLQVFLILECNFFDLFKDVLNFDDEVIRG